MKYLMGTLKQINDQSAETVTVHIDFTAVECLIGVPDLLAGRSDEQAKSREVRGGFATSMMRRARDRECSAMGWLDVLQGTAGGRVKGTVAVRGVFLRVWRCRRGAFALN